MIAETAVAAGRKLAGKPTAGADDYWASRVWDREECALEPVLGPHFRTETIDMVGLVADYTTIGDIALDVACGVGVFSEALLKNGASSVTALDVSTQALSRVRDRVGETEQLTCVQADVRTYRPSPQPDIVVCVDAVHHIGSPLSVVEHLLTLVKPGGVVVGNIWTEDHFHEFQRLRRGNMAHTAASLNFLLASAYSRGSRRSPALRTELIRDADARRGLTQLGVAEHLSSSRYWLRFAIRRTDG